MFANESADPEDSLSQSLRVQSRASDEGFDWGHIDGVFEKVDEEVGEIRAALEAGDYPHARRELGDLLLVTVNLARFLQADPREELDRATRRFECRYEQLKIALAAEGKSAKTCAPDELEACWQRIKPVADKLLKKGLDMHRGDGANSSSNL